MDIQNILKGIDVAPVVDVSGHQTQRIDLSTSNKDLKSVDVSSSIALGKYIDSLHDQPTIYWGGYMEKRGIYARSEHFTEGQPERNIHLGIDIWCPADTSVIAPLDGIIHSFKNNHGLGNYGPTILLEHAFVNTRFYTLYGHLSKSSLDNLSVGSEVMKGETIATLGSSDVNGDYPPHLHFQIIVDLGNWNGDYPGVCSKNHIDYYKENCPDPLRLLPFLS